MTYTWQLIIDGEISQAEKNRIESGIDVNGEGVSFCSPDIATGNRAGLVFMFSASDGQYNTGKIVYVCITGQ